MMQLTKGVSEDLPEVWLHAYSLPRPFDGLNIPLPVQSCFLRNYAKNKGYFFVLPAVEWCIDGLYIQLRKLMSTENVSEIGMTSIKMLPLMKEQQLNNLLDCSQEVNFHCVLENLIINNYNLPEYAKEYRSLAKLSERNFSKLDQYFQ